MAVAVRVAPTADERDDHALVAAVRAGDDGAFESLFERYGRRITTFAYGMVGDWARAEDVTQEVFISALRRMRETERPIAFKPWVYEIARNACIDQFRRSRRAEEVSIDAGVLGAGDQGRLADAGPTPHAAMESKEKLGDLVGAFGGLSQSHHDILVLRELEGLSYRQIGERMGLSRPSVESTLFRARRRLTEEYDELTTGRRCERVRGTIEAASDGALGLRDRGRVARHVAHCQSCRRHAVRAGAGDLVFERTSRRARVAALLPLPMFLRRARRPDAAETTLNVAGGPVSPALVRAGFALAPAAQAGGSWSRVAATSLSVLAAAGAGFALQPAQPARRPLPRPVPGPVATAATGAAASLSALSVVSELDPRLVLSPGFGAGAAWPVPSGSGSGAQRRPEEGSAAGELAGPAAPGAAGGPAASLPRLRPPAVSSPVSRVTTTASGGVPASVRAIYAEAGQLILPTVGTVTTSTAHAVTGASAGLLGRLQRRAGHGLGAATARRAQSLQSAARR